LAAVTLIGLDIGSTSIRAVETRRGKAGPAITNFGQAMLPNGAVQGGVIHDDKAVTLALKQLWATTKFRSRQVVLGVTNRQVVVREMSVANLPDREMRKSLPFQVRDVLPLPVERSLLDFYRLEDPGTNKTVRGLLIAAPKEAVLTAVHATERAGLHVARVDLASFALLRAASRLDSQVEAIVDIGADSMTIVVHTDGEPVIVRTIPRGGAEMTEMIAKRLDVTVAEAESLKCRVGLQAAASGTAASGTAEVGTAEAGTAERQIAERQTANGGDPAEAIQEAVRPLINEIRSSFAYLISGDQQTRVMRLALSGGGSLLPGLVDALTAQLSVDVVIADPLVRLHDVSSGRPDGLERFRSSAAVSVGLTLGAV
jgi:type IV pilus assembly protein PilM